MKIPLIMLLLFCSFIEISAQKKIEVPGSRATIIIPDGVITSPYFSAFTKPDDFEMLIVEFKGNWESKIKEIDSTAYVNSGVKVYEEYEMEVNGYLGKVIHSYSNPEADAVQFLFGDSTFFTVRSLLWLQHCIK